MKVYEAVTTAVKLEGAEILFAVMGDANQNMIVDLGETHGLQFVHAKHEQSAVSMADGYSRFSGKMGLASVTQGPGYTNATTSLVAARLHRSPLLLLAGHTSLNDPYNPQGEIDQHALALLTTKAGVVLNHPKNVDYALGEAFRYLRGKHGPFIINLPQDVQNAEVPDANWAYHPKYKAEDPQPPRREDLQAAAQLIASSQRPALLCGLGARNARAEAEIRQLAEYLGAPVGVTLLAKGLFADYPLYLGVSGGLGNGLAIETFKHCDLLIAIGASLNEWTTHFGSVLENKKIIQIDRRQEAFGWYSQVDLGLEGDAKLTVSTLLEYLQQSDGARKPDATIEKVVKGFAPESFNYDDGEAVDPRRAMQHLEEQLPKSDRIIVIDGGHAAMVANQILSSSNADDWGNGLDFGAVGQGLSIAIGACFARPGRRVTHVTADTAFMMNVADFHTAVNHNLPLTVFVFNDTAVGQEKHDLVHKKLNPKYADVKQPEFDKLAVGFGAKGFRVEHPDDLGEIDKALQVTTGPVIVDVRINGEVELPVSWEIAQHLS